MKKVSQLLVAGTVVTTAFAGQVEVHANTNPVTSAPTEEAVQQVSTETLSAQEARVDEAKAKLDATKQEMVGVIQDITELEQLAQANTPEALTQAEGLVAAAEEAKTQATEEVTKAQEAVDQAQKEVTKQEEVVKAATDKQTAAQGQVDEAQKAVDAAQAKIDGANSVAKSAVTEAQGKVEAAQKALEQAKQELQAAQKADQKRANDIEAAQKAVQTAQADVDKAQAELTTAQGRVDNSFTNLAAYTAALIKHEKLSHAEKAVDQVLAEAAAAAYRDNNYVSSKDDQARTVEVNNLSPEVRQELNLFALSLVNDIRKAAGLEPALLSQNLMDYADKVSDIVVEVNKLNHYSTNLDQATRAKYGLDNYGFRPQSTSEYTPRRGDAELLPPQKTMTVDALKEWIYNTYKAIYFKPVDIYGEQSFTYALSKSGVSDAAYRSEIPTYTALDFSSTDHWNNIHIVFIDRKNFNFSEIPYDVKNFVEIKDPNADAGNQATAAEQKLAAARAKLSDATHALKSAEQVYEKVPGATLTVQTRQRLLDEAKQALATAEANLLASGTVSPADLDALNKAKATLAEAKEALNTLSAETSAAQGELQKVIDILNKAEATLKTAQTNQKDTETKLEEAKTALVRLKNAPSLLLVAQAYLIELENQLKAEEALYQKEADRLKAIKVLSVKPSSPSPALPSTAKDKAEPSRQQKTLPQTGDQSSVLTYLGVLATGLAALAYKRRRDQCSTCAEKLAFQPLPTYH